MKGHNNPPPVEQFALHIEDLFALVSGTTAGATVTTDEQEAALDSLLDDVRKARKDADAQRVIEAKPFDDGKAAVQAAWKPLIARCDMATDAIKALLTPYRNAKQRAKDDAARIAREEAAAKLHAAQGALRKSDDIEARFAAEEQLEQAAKLTAVANKIDRSASGLRTFWNAEIIDRKAALIHLIARYPERFEALIQQMADEAARSDRAPIPGVLFHHEKRAA